MASTTHQPQFKSLLKDITSGGDTMNSVEAPREKATSNHEITDPNHTYFYGYSRSLRPSVLLVAQAEPDLCRARF